MRACQTCRHYVPGPTIALPPARTEAVAGVCRARPPLDNFKWPKVRPSDFCGEHAEALATNSAKAGRKAPKGEQTQLPETNP